MAAHCHRHAREAEASDEFLGGASEGGNSESDEGNNRS